MLNQTFAILIGSPNVRIVVYLEQPHLQVLVDDEIKAEKLKLEAVFRPMEGLFGRFEDIG